MPDDPSRQAAREVELAPCPNPWCESPADRAPVIDRDLIDCKGEGTECAIGCPYCDIWTPPFATEAEAIAAWNHRPAILAAEQRARRQALEAVFGPSDPQVATILDALNNPPAIRQLGGDDA